MDESSSKPLSILIDIDGTISSDPSGFCELMCALKASGNTIYIVTGSNPGGASGGTWQEKLDYLESVNVTKCWDSMTLVDGDIPKQKALFAQQNHIDIAIDNNKDNANALIGAGVKLVLVPWASREPQKGK